MENMFTNVAIRRQVLLYPQCVVVLCGCVCVCVCVWVLCVCVCVCRVCVCVVCVCVCVCVYVCVLGIVLCNLLAVIPGPLAKAMPIA